MPRTPDQYQEMKLRRRGQMLNVGLRLFATLGYDGVKTDMVTKALRCSHGLFFHYFENKEDFFLCVWNELVLPYPGLPNYSSCLNLGGVEGLKSLCDYYAKSGKLDAKSLQKLKIYTLFPLNEEVNKAFAKKMKGHSFQATLSTLLKQGQAQGKVVAGPVNEIVRSALTLFEKLLNEPTSLSSDLIYNLLTKGL